MSPTAWTRGNHRSPRSAKLPEKSRNDDVTGNRNAVIGEGASTAAEASAECDARTQSIRKHVLHRLKA